MKSHLLQRWAGLVAGLLLMSGPLLAQNDLNLALNKPGNTGSTATASASSVESTNYPASNANDGDESTRWASQFADPQSLVINLGSVQPIDRIRISWEQAYAVDFELQVSSDATFGTYTVVKKVTGNVPTTHNSQFVNEFSGLGATGQYVRMVGTQRHNIGGNVYGYSIYEFEVFSFSTDTSKNLAVSKSPSASSSQSATFSADKAFDNDPTTRWSTGSPEYQTLVVDMGQPTSVSRVYLNWETAYARSFELQVSSDGTDNNWTSFATLNDNHAYYNELSVANVVGRYFRVLAKTAAGVQTDNGVYYGFSIYEFALYGAGPLPVTLRSFGAVPQGSGVAVSWTTATELNNAGWEVQRSANGTDFTSLAKVAGAGNSQTLKAYQYVDALPLRTLSYYRLLQRDLNGSVAYGPVVAVRAAGAGSGLASLDVYPNPTPDQATVQWEAAGASAGTWSLTTTTGQVVHREAFAVQPGPNAQAIDLRPYAAGSYVLTVEAAGQTLRRQLVQKVQ